MDLVRRRLFRGNAGNALEVGKVVSVDVFYAVEEHSRGGLAVKNFSAFHGL